MQVVRAGELRGGEFKLGKVKAGVKVYREGLCKSYLRGDAKCHKMVVPCNQLLVGVLI